MSDKEKEYKELFIAESQEQLEELNRLLTDLEKHPQGKSEIQSIFRITHTLKGNAAGMGFSDLSAFAHTLEDLFGLVRDDKLSLNDDLFTQIYKSLDILSELLQQVVTGQKVRYKGLQTKLRVIIESVSSGEANQESAIHDNNQVTETENDHAEDDLNNEMKEAEPLSSPEESASENTMVEANNSLENEESGSSVAGEIPEKERPKGKNTGTEQNIAFSDLIQVPVRKLDHLLNLVGELVIERDRLIASAGNRKSSNEYSRLNRISSDLQYSVMDVRLIQVGFLFNKFHRVVRDAARMEDKAVRLEIKGSDTEIDRNILQIISDSLIHLIRNSISHGIETKTERTKLDKGEEGVVTLSARSENDGVVIEIQDDGQGINIQRVRDKAIARNLITRREADSLSDEDIILLIFEPGFSTMEQVTSLAGRGVGMDVVKSALDSVGGTISVHSEPGKGSKFILKLPSTMAVKGTLLFESEEVTYAIPLTNTKSVLSLYKKEIKRLSGGLAITFQDRTVPVIFLVEILRSKSVELASAASLKKMEELHDEQSMDIIIVEFNGRYFALVVDKLLQQKEIVEKTLKPPLDVIKVISGVTILGNGNVCLVLNVAMIHNFMFQRAKSLNSDQTV